MYHAFSRSAIVRRCAAGWPTDIATSRSTRPGCSAAKIHATAAPQSWPTTRAVSSSRASRIGTRAGAARVGGGAGEAVRLDLGRLVRRAEAAHVGRDRPQARLRQGVDLMAPEV